MKDKSNGETIRAMNGAPPPGWTPEEWAVYLDGMVKKTRANEAAAIEDGSISDKMHYGNSPWGDE
jgi:hypothetical protein